MRWDVYSVLGMHCLIFSLKTAPSDILLFLLYEKTKAQRHEITQPMSHSQVPSFKCHDILSSWEDPSLSFMGEVERKCEFRKPSFSSSIWLLLGKSSADTNPKPCASHTVFTPGGAVSCTDILTWQVMEIQGLIFPLPAQSKSFWGENFQNLSKVTFPFIICSTYCWCFPINNLQLLLKYPR